MLKRLALICAFSITILTPIAGALYLVDAAAKEIEEPKPEVWVPATAADSDPSEKGGIAMIWDAAPSVPAPDWGSRVVQKIELKVGDEVRTGTEIAVIDRITRIGVHTDIPLDRSLKRGDSGPDVQALNETLAELEFTSDSGENFTYATELGVRELAKSLGAGNEATFDPGWFVYLPSKTGEADDVHLEVGQPAVAVGEDVVTYRAQPQKAVVYGEDQYDDLMRSLENDEDDESFQELPETSIEAGLAISIEGEEFTSPEQEDNFSDEDLKELGALMSPGTPGTSAHITRQVPEDAQQIPAAATYSDSAGNTCTLARSDDGQSISQAIEIVDSSFGVSIVTGLGAEDSVLVNPPVEERSSCR